MHATLTNFPPFTWVSACLCVFHSCLSSLTQRNPRGNQFDKPLSLVPCNTGLLPHHSLFPPVMAPLALLTVVLIACAAATDGPILSFNFDGTTTSADGTVLSPVGSGISFVQGMVSGSQAVSFPQGGSAYLTSAALASLPSGNAPRSVAMWVMAYAIPSSNGRFALTSWGTPSSYGSFSTFIWNGQGGNVYGIGWDADGYAGFSNHDLTVSVWQHVAYTYDGSLVVVYIDGAVVYSSRNANCNGNPSYAGVTNTGGNTPLVVGTGVGVEATDFFPGAIDELLIYDRALSSVEVAALTLPTISSTPSSTRSSSPSTTPTPSTSPSFTPTATLTPSTTPNPSCLPSHFRPYLFHFLDGVFSTALPGTPTERACQLSACNAAATAYVFNLLTLQCGLLTNVTAAYPDTTMATFASGVLWSEAPPAAS